MSACTVCGAYAGYQCCDTLYCGAVCQYADWSNHMPICGHAKGGKKKSSKQKQEEVLKIPSSAGKTPTQTTLVPGFVLSQPDPIGVEQARTLLQRVYFVPSDNYPKMYGDEARLEGVYDEVAYYHSRMRILQSGRISLLWDVQAQPTLTRHAGHRIDIWRTAQSEAEDQANDNGIVHKLLKGVKDPLSIEYVHWASRTRERDRATTEHWPLYLIRWQGAHDSTETFKGMLYVGWQTQAEAVFHKFDEALALEDRIVVMGCHQCQERSPTMLLFYLVYRGLSWSEALELVKEHSAQFYFYRNLRDGQTTKMLPRLQDYHKAHYRKVLQSALQRPID